MSELSKEQKEALARMKKAIQEKEAAKSGKPLEEADEGYQPSPQPATQSITGAGGIESQEQVGSPGRPYPDEDQT